METILTTTMPDLVSPIRISIQGCEYLVDFGQGVNPRFHRVNKEKHCSCNTPSCPAIDAVREYLLDGGQRAPDPLPPCPICGAKVSRDPKWDGKYTHELGWRCSQGGVAHFLQQKMERIRKNWQEHPFLIPPTPGYPGVRRDEILTYEDLLPVYRKAAAEGYDPAA
ncbi:MAG: hypothetical protein GYA58_04045 [Anaerolineaceae bacterium]|nr:hypothetical protein [Anaerolineaceae bacterium]